jgi:hypothetical protein
MNSTHVNSSQSNHQQKIDSVTPQAAQPINFYVYQDRAGLFFIVVFALALIIAILLFHNFSGAHAEENIEPRPQSDLQLMEKYDGNWAQTYRSADEKSKQALELLFRCHIIPEREFSHSRVSPEHIAECVWIANLMLRQQPLDVWLAKCSEAQKAFEESVTECFAARTDARSYLNQTPRPGGLDMSASSMGSARSPHGSGEVNLDMPEDGSLPPDSQYPAILRSAEGRDRLILRCREIMASTSRRPVLTEAAAVPSNSARSMPG